MSTTIQPLFEPVQLGSSAASLYTASAKTRVDAMTVSNPDAAVAYKLTIYWVPKSGSASSANAIVSARTILPGESWNVLPFVGQVLGVGDMIWAMADTAAKLNLFASGALLSW